LILGSLQQFAAQFLGFGCKPTALFITESHSATADLLLKGYLTQFSADYYKQN